MNKLENDETRFLFEDESFIFEAQDNILNNDNYFNALLDTALIELDFLFAKKPKREKAFKYLMDLWPSFAICQIDPVPTPIEPLPLSGEVDDKKIIKDNYHASVDNYPHIIRLKEGWKILDFGDGLITSAGENYGRFSTGRLLRTVHYMIERIFQRGAKKVMFSGSSPAKRYAWIYCKQLNLKTHFNPGEEDHRCQENITRISTNKLSSRLN